MSESMKIDSGDLGPLCHEVVLLDPKSGRKINVQVDANRGEIRIYAWTALIFKNIHIQDAQGIRVQFCPLDQIN